MCARTNIALTCPRGGCLLNLADAMYDDSATPHWPRRRVGRGAPTTRIRGTRRWGSRRPTARFHPYGATAGPFELSSGIRRRTSFQASGLADCASDSTMAAKRSRGNSCDATRRNPSRSTAERWPNIHETICGPSSGPACPNIPRMMSLCSSSVALCAMTGTSNLEGRLGGPACLAELKGVPFRLHGNRDSLGAVVLVACGVPASLLRLPAATRIGGAGADDMRARREVGS